MTTTSAQLVYVHLLIKLNNIYYLIIISISSHYSLGPHHSSTIPRGTMVSRRKILSRSRDDLNIDQAYMDEEEDIWYQKDKLFKVSCKF